MSYLERYLAGEHEQVWAELLALGADVRREPVLPDARAVAAETMRRVRRNCERIVVRLQAAGYEFELYPDGEERWTEEGPLIAPTAESRADVAALAGRVGPLPLSLEAFWSEVGSVDLVGMHPSLPDMSDPLVVDPPEAALEELEEWEADPDRDEDADESSRFEAPLAPDDYHKDNVSGGAPYGVQLPDPAADFVLRNERHALNFVPYLRLAILRWGGFPGLDGRPEKSFGLVDGLIEGLELF